MTNDVQLDLFGDVAKRENRQALIEAFRANRMLDCCTGKPAPRDGKWIVVDGVQVKPEFGEPGYEPGLPLRRCGLCGELTTDYSVNHEMSWTGCSERNKKLHGYWNRQYQSREEMSADRHDNAHHPRCARPGCGDAWGIHTVGSELPEEASCHGWCGCKGYVRPTEGET